MDILSFFKNNDVICILVFLLKIFYNRFIEYFFLLIFLIEKFFMFFDEIFGKIFR